MEARDNSFLLIQTNSMRFPTVFRQPHLLIYPLSLCQANLSNGSTSFVLLTSAVFAISHLVALFRWSCLAVEEREPIYYHDFQYCYYHYHYHDFISFISFEPSAWMSPPPSLLFCVFSLSSFYFLRTGLPLSPVLVFLCFMITYLCIYIYIYIYMFIV